MKIKKLLSTFAALAIAATSFAGLGITANAAAPDGFTTLYEKNSTFGDANIWTEDAMAEWTQTNSDTAALALDVPTTEDDVTDHHGIWYNPTKPGAAYNATKSFDVTENAIVNYDIDWYFGSSTGRTSNYEFLKIGSDVQLMWNSSYNVYYSTDGGTTLSDSVFYAYNATQTKNVNVTIDTATNSVTSLKFDGTELLTASIGLSSEATADAVTFGFIRGGSTSNWGYPNGIKNITVSQKEQVVTTADYTVKFVDADGNEIKDAETRTSVVGNTVTLVPSDETAIYANDKKYIYDEANSTTSATLESTGTTLTVTFREAATYSYTVNATVEDVAVKTIATGTGFEGDTVAVAFPKYVLKDGVLYSKAANSGNPNYGTNITLTEDNQIENWAYTATDIDNIVYHSEGEDVEGLTKITDSNAAIRSSQNAAAYAVADTTLATLPAGSYKVHAVLYSPTSGGANLSFDFGGNEFALTAGNANWTDVFSDVITVGTESDLVFKTSGGKTAAIDFIYVEKIADTVISAVTTTVPATATAVTAPTTVKDAEDDAEVNYAELVGEKKVATIYVRVANATTACPVITLSNGETMTVTKATVDGSGYFICQYVADDADTVTVTGVTYEGATAWTAE